MTWSGSDVGSGIAAYDVFVSDDGKDWVSVLTATAQTETVLKTLGGGFSLGFVVDGPAHKNILIRAIGPTLKSLFGVTDAERVRYDAKDALTGRYQYVPFDVPAGTTRIDLAYRLEDLPQGWVAVFVPSAPTPMSGNVMYFPAGRVRPLGITMIQAMAIVKRNGLGSGEALRGIDLKSPEGL